MVPRTLFPVLRSSFFCNHFCNHPCQLTRELKKYPGIWAGRPRETHDYVEAHLAKAWWYHRHVLEPGIHHGRLCCRSLAAFLLLSLFFPTARSNPHIGRLNVLTAKSIASNAIWVEKELGIEGFDKVVDKHFDKGYDKGHEKLHRHRHRDDREDNNSDRNNMGEARQRDRGYDSESDDSYDQRPRRRRDDRDDRRPRQQNNREDDRPRRLSPPGQSYHPRAIDPTYIPYQSGNARLRDGAPPGPQYHDNSPRPSSRGDYTPASSTRGAPNEMARYSRPRDRSPSRSRSQRQRRRSHSSSRSRSRSTGRDFTDSPLMALDSSTLGLGAGIAGALIGGYIGRETSDRHQKRGTALGAILGGIGANILENRVRIYRDEQKEEQREAREKWDARHKEGRKDTSRRSRRVESPQRW
jgi:hypothetical protein